MVDLEKKSPPQLVSLAKTAKVVLEKRNLGTHVAAVGLCLDISASMKPLFTSGMVQGIIERVMALGLNFDDNGAIDVFSFGLEGHNLGEYKATDFAGAADRIVKRTPLEGGTCYAPVMREVLSHYGFKTGGFLSGMFGGGNKAAPRKDPVYMLFVTDGENSDQADARKAIIDASKHPVFFQFIGIGGAGFKFLKELDSMDGRFIDNANFFEVRDPVAMPEAELYEKMTAEYPSWIKLAKEKNLLQK